MRSSSLHRLNADAGLSRVASRLWFPLNGLNNRLLPEWKERSLEVRHFAVRMEPEAWARLDPMSSPSRAFCDLFWMHLPWAAIASAVDEIHVFDTGCGSGDFGPRLREWSGGRIASYTGVDVEARPSWPDLIEAHPFVRLHVADSAHLDVPLGVNLVVSQSAVEHFPDDLRYFRQLRDFVAARETPVLQVHAFPSAACLELYPRHGVRQYTPRTVSLISRLFRGSRRTLYTLGGSRSNAVHRAFVTEPLFLQGRGDLRVTEAGRYATARRAAMIADMDAAGADPSFYALVIQTGVEVPLP